MYKSYAHCLNREYEVETKGKATVYVHEGMAYIQNEDGEEVFAINQNRLEAISLNYNVEKEDKELIYNQDDAIEFIYNKTGEAMKHYSKEGIREILEADENYMRSVGIIED